MNKRREEKELNEMMRRRKGSKRKGGDGMDGWMDEEKHLGF